MTYDKRSNINERREVWAFSYKERLEDILKTGDSREVTITAGDRKHNKMNTYIILRESLQNIISYWKYLVAGSVKPFSASQEISYLVHLCHFIQKPLEEYKPEDLDKFFGKYKSQDHVNFLKRVIKSFLKWNKLDIYNTIKFGRKTQKIPEVLTMEEIQKMSDMADNPRDRLTPLLLCETATRASEFCCIKIKDLTFDEFSCKICVSGKTGSRTLPIVQCVPLLKEYINFYKGKNNPENYLFCGFTKNTYNQQENYPLTPSGLTLIIKKLASRAGISKVWCHKFRHTRLSWLANHGLGDFQLKQFAGFSPSSTMANVYINMNCNDLKNKILEINGITKPKESIETPSLTIKCPNTTCGEVNSISNKFCKKCYQPLQIKEITETERGIKFIVKLLPTLMELVKDKEIKPEDLEEIVKSLGKPNEKVKEVK